MPKKIKLNLEDLKVESFVTELNKNEKKEVKGGGGTVAGTSCNRPCIEPD
jgi:hypothetical protein